MVEWPYPVASSPRERESESFVVQGSNSSIGRRPVFCVREIPAAVRLTAGEGFANPTPSR